MKKTFIKNDTLFFENGNLKISELVNLLKALPFEVLFIDSAGRIKLIIHPLDPDLKLNQRITSHLFFKTMPATFDFLEKLNDFRVNLVHKVFQNNIIRHDFDSAEFVLEYTNKRIIPMTNKAIEINRTIIGIIDLYRSDLHDYKVQVGLPLPC